MQNDNFLNKVQAACALYFKHHGRHHKLIESEMRSLGYANFSRRAFYTRTKNGEATPGWPERFGWRALLSAPPAAAGGVTKTHTAVSVPSAFSVVDPPNETGATEYTENTEANRNSEDAFHAWLKASCPQWKWDWRHQKYLYKKLAKITDGTSKRLMIFMPPRHGKSELVTVRYSAWRLSQDPSLNIIVGSYGQKLANKFSRKIKNVLAEQEDGAADTAGKTTVMQRVSSPAESDTFLDTRVPPRNSAIRMFPRMRPANTVAEWETPLGGGVRAVGVGAGVTGYGAKLVVIDDPVKSRAQAESLTFRTRVWDWFNDDIYTRLEPGAAMILIQPRWHEDDLAGRLMKQMEDGGEQWEIVNLPALAVAKAPNAESGVRKSQMRNKETSARSQHASSQNISGIGNPQSAFRTPQSDNPLSAVRIPHSSDPLGRIEGQALCPERFDEAELIRIKRQLGSYSFSALYQQDPTPLDGGLFKRAWFKKIVDRAPEKLRWCRGYDLAVSTGTQADYTASFRVAKSDDGNLYIADGFRARIEYPEQRRYVRERMLAEKNTSHGIEKALHGQALVQDLRRDLRASHRAIQSVNIDSDKFTRALAWAGMAEDGKVILVRGPWIDEFLDEICRFPKVEHDDQVDAVSVAVRLLAKNSGKAFHAF